VCSHEDIVSREASFLELINGILDVVVDQNWLWGIKRKLWNPYPGFESRGSGFLLDLLT